MEALVEDADLFFFAGCGSLMRIGAVAPVMSPGVMSGGILLNSLFTSSINSSSAFHIVMVYFTGVRRLDGGFTCADRFRCGPPGLTGPIGEGCLDRGD